MSFGGSDGLVCPRKLEQRNALRGPEMGLNRPWSGANLSRREANPLRREVTVTILLYAVIGLVALNCTLRALLGDVARWNRRLGR